MSPTRLIEVLRSPETVSTISLEQWNEVVVEGRKFQLLGQLAARLQNRNFLSEVPPQVRRHLDLELLTATRRAEAAMWEVSSMRRAIDGSYPLTFIKGCAYVLGGDNNANGRTFSDIDVVVPKAFLSELESLFFSLGWKPSTVSEYDDAYYRNWMHELPPMEHVRRNTVLDLHHAINPPVSRYYIEPTMFFKTKVEVMPGIFILSPVDRVIHCAMHLLQEGEPKKLLRDLFDLFSLVNQHFPSVDELKRLRFRASELNVAKVSMSAVAASLEIFETRSVDVGDRSEWLQACLVKAAVTAHNKSNSLSTWIGGMAGVVILVHSHWMKMPLKLLIPHLCRKSWLRLHEGKDGS